MEGHSIMHNMPLCQDIVKQYGKKHRPPRSLLKIDLRKAYDMLDSEFYKGHVGGTEFSCVSFAQFLLILNGYPMPLFKSKRGIRLGHPMSHAIFVLCMEYFSRMLKTASNLFNLYFPRICNKIKLNYLCFTDDLMLFCRRELGLI